MNFNLYTADRQTHVRIVIVALLGATLVATLGILAHGAAIA